MGKISPIPLPDVPPYHRGSMFARASGAKFVADTGAGTIEFYSYVGDGGITDSAFSAELARFQGRDVVLRINSGGGDVFQGLTIANEIAAYPGKVRAEIMGLAASAASIIAIAADSVAMAKNAHFMIHNAHAVTLGDSAAHDQMAEVLGKIDSSLAAAYVEKTGQPSATIRAAMNRETWYSAAEAKQAGFADEIIGEAAPAARFDLSAFTNLPEELRRSPPVQAQSDVTRSQVERYLRDRYPYRAARKMAAGEWPTSEHPETSFATRIEQGLAELRAIRSF